MRLVETISKAIHAEQVGIEDGYRGVYWDACPFRFWPATWAWHDGWEKGMKKKSAEWEENWKKDHPDNDPFNLTIGQCSKCGLKLKRVMWYSCPESNCPTGLGRRTM